MLLILSLCIVTASIGVIAAAARPAISSVSNVIAMHNCRKRGLL